MRSLIGGLVLLALAQPVFHADGQLVVMNAARSASGRRAGAEVGAGRAVDVCPDAFPHGLALSCRRTNEGSQPPVTLRFRCDGGSTAGASAGARRAVTEREGAVSGILPATNATEEGADVAVDVPPCAVIPASGHMGGLPAGWVSSPDDSVTFRPLDESTTIYLPDKSGALVYSFGVPRKGRYAFVLDMTTSAAWNHNDVWVQLLSGGGLLLRREGRSLKASRGFVKAYHNAEGRAAHSVSIDSDGHSLSSKEVLVPGTAYYFALAGRSTMLTVHRAILFPCEGMGCETTSKYWQNMISRCK